MEDVTLRGLINKIDSLQEDVLSLQNKIDNFDNNDDCEGCKYAGIELSMQELCESYLKQYQDLCESVKLCNSNNVSSYVSELNVVKQQMINKVATINSEYLQSNTVMYNTIDSLIKRLDRIHIDIINNDDNITITYTDHNGKSEYGTILKVRADELTLTLDHTGILRLKLRLDDNSFIILNDVIYPTKLTGKVSNKTIDADLLINDLGNASENIVVLTKKLESLLKLISTTNGYIASNNFKTSKIDLDKLTKFVIENLSTSTTIITEDLIPTGTKIKNTFDNHIWVLNRNLVGDESICKWEDFGSDTICVASNDGVHGLVVGSNEKFRGYIDLQGVISINGLQEELESIILGVKGLSNQISKQESRLSKIESMLGINSNNNNN